MLLLLCTANVFERIMKLYKKLMKGAVNVTGLYILGDDIITITTVNPAGWLLGQGLTIKMSWPCRECHCLEC